MAVEQLSSKETESWNKTQVRLISVMLMSAPYFGAYVHYIYDIGLGRILILFPLIGVSFLPAAIKRIYTKKAIDERERDYRFKAYAFAYRVVSSTALLLLLVAHITLRYFDNTAHLTADDLMTLTLALMAVVIFSPIAYLAWMIKPPVDDTEDE